jgi:hypothetical protein
MGWSTKVPSLIRGALINSPNNNPYAAVYTRKITEWQLR